MKVIADICLIPIGTEVSVSRYVKVAHQSLKDAHLNAQLHPYGTIIEGDYDQVCAAIKKSMEAVHAMGVARISLSIRLGSRLDKDQSAQDKVDAVLKG